MIASLSHLSHWPVLAFAISEPAAWLHIAIAINLVSWRLVSSLHSPHKTIYVVIIGLDRPVAVCTISSCDIYNTFRSSWRHQRERNEVADLSRIHHLEAPGFRKYLWHQAQCRHSELIQMTKICLSPLRWALASPTLRYSSIGPCATHDN